MTAILEINDLKKTFDNGTPALKGVNLKINKGELLQGSTPRRCPDISKLADLGYTPSVTIEEGLNTTLNWYKNYYLNN